ncbi:hypothetical protein A6A04_18730 [Paramagnetospirillum marisnigri]|uniref:Uncharacterized protein n=2 Tax=Paramagnetospirillum marisnigri TaxID=1285242 RepID=A0A178MP21_9PROT|nr:hypothetical protein A6A04_18730 [Paramagnetospirillum marisnigri]
MKRFPEVPRFIVIQLFKDFGGDEKKDLNFKVPPEFHADYKTFAVQCDVPMSEILYRSFQFYRMAMNWTR